MNPDRYDLGELTGRLSRVRVLTLSLGALTSVVLALLVLALSWLLVSFFDMVVGLPWDALRALALLGGLAAIALLCYTLYRTLSASQSIKMYAARIGRELSEIGLDILAALDLAEADTERLGYSEVLIRKTINDITARVRKLDLYVAVRRRSLLMYSIPLAALLIAALLWMAGAPDSFYYSLARMEFFLGLTAESGVAISVKPGDADIGAGEPLNIEAEVKGFVESDALLHLISETEETRFRMTETAASGPGLRNFFSGIARVDKDLDYFVSMAGQRTRTYHISVVEDPRITGGMIRLRPPAYTGLPAQVIPDGVWDIAALYGTRADFALKANCSPDSARFVESAPDGRAKVGYFTITEDSLLYRMQLTRDLSYSLELVTPGSDMHEPHGPHSVKVVADEAPYVRIESPEKEMLLEADMIVPLSVRALDDYGISMMRLHYSSPAESGFSALAYTGKTEARSDRNWDVGELDIFPGEAVYYYVEVADNDALRGPKVTRSETYVARVPTLYEFYAEIEDRQDSEIEDLEEIAEEMKQLDEAIDELAQEMKRERDVDWEKEQTMKQALERQGELAQDLDEISASIDETLDMMSESELVDFEVIEKMEEIRRLLDEVATEDFLKSLELMQKAMEQLKPEDIRAAWDQLDLTQEDLMRRLDATIEMLKRLKLEQQMDAVSNLAESMLEGEKRVNEDLREGRDMAESEQAERGLMNDARDLARMMDELAADLGAERNPAASEMDEAREFMQSSGIEEKMSGKISSMSGGNRQGGQETGQDIEKDLTELTEMISEAENALTGGQQREVVDALINVMNDLREVSARHEDVMNGILDMPGEAELGELARREIVYKEALDRAAEALFDASKKSLFVPPELGKAALAVAESMEMASGQLHEGRPGQANTHMKSALRSMNQLIALISEATDQASSCSSSSSMCNAFQSLENMSCQQMGINMGTQSLFDESGQLSMEARSQMARLAAEQEAVQKGVEELMREYGNRGEILGRLDDLIDEAERVVEDLRRQRVNQETIRRQERILTRLLDAQKSLRRRDYSKRRESRPGEEYAVKPPPEMSLEERERMMEDILYRRRGYYPPEYEDLIRAYMKAISDQR